MLNFGDEGLGTVAIHVRTSRLIGTGSGGGQFRHSLDLFVCLIVLVDSGLVTLPVVHCLLPWFWLGMGSGVPLAGAGVSWVRSPDGGSDLVLLRTSVVTGS